MDTFCGSTFWDLNVTWNTERPDFTPCFQETVLVWIPCGFLWLFSLLELFFSYRSKAKHIPWTILIITKIIISVLLACLALSDMIRALVLYSNGEVVYPSDYYASFIKAISFILVIVLTNMARIRGVTTSAVLFIFWFLLSLKELIHYRTFWLQIADENYIAVDFDFIIVTCTTSLVLGQFVLSCFADTKSISKAGQADMDCPEESASFLSRMTFWWFNNLARLGYRQPLTMIDMWNLADENSTEPIVERFDKYWIPMTKKALDKTQNSVKVDDYQHKKDDDDPKATAEVKLNILIPVLKTFWWLLTASGVLKLIGSLMAFISPIILDWLITFVAADEPYWRGFYYAGLLFFSSMVESLINSQYEYMVYVLAMRIRSSITSAIYRKSLLLSSKARRSYTVGEIVNLMAVDIQRVQDYFHMIHFLWSAPLQIAVALYMLWAQIGVSTLAGLGILLLMIPLNGVITMKMKSVQVVVMAEKDKRTKLMNEILNGIKVLKLYGWEESFQAQVIDIRKKEIAQLRIQAYISAVIIFAFTSAPFLVALASFGMYVLIDPTNILDANKAFVSLSLFNILRVPFAFLPMVIMFGAMFLVSLKRLNIYLGSDELDPDSVSYNPREESPVLIQDGTFTWEAGAQPLLKDINFSINRGSLVAVVGTVGAGKSSLLAALLGDMEKMAGRVNIAGSMAYVPQQAWIQNATLRQNILFTKAFDEKRYKRVLDACCLTPDLEILPGGDMTEIGEKGINLSGGQKQRVSLARAVYNNSEIYLFDDPLSAVDSHVSKDLFDRVIGPKSMLKKKTRILVTHRITVLPDVDTIMVIKDGEISETGSYDELLKQKGAFAEFLIHHITQQTDEGDIVSPDDLQMMEDIANKVGGPELQRQLSRFSGGESEAALSEAEGGRRSISRASLGGSVDTLRRRSSTSLRRKSSLPAKGQEFPTIDKSKLTEAEMAESGSVKFAVYWNYFKACGLSDWFWVVFTFAASNGFNAASSIWLSEWSNDSLDPANANNTKLRDLRLGVYGGLGGGETLFGLASSIILSLCTLAGAKLVHDQCLDHILRAPMSFFDTTPLGRIMNRFSKDIDSMDNVIRHNIRMLLIQMFKAIVSIIIISLQTVYILVAVIPLGVIYYVVQNYYIATSRQLKRLESISRSPIYTHFSETVAGCSSVRAYGAATKFIDYSNKLVDTNNTTYFPSLAASRWLAVRLEFLGYCISFFAALFAVISRDTLSAGIAGLSISYAMTITATLNMLVRSWADVETNVVSVERCLEYTTTPVEAPRKIEGGEPPPNWPDAGTILFSNYSTRYREGLDLVLKNISCQINSKEKVGIVGRTGAGKSSLTLSLLRLIEASQGSITIDGIEIAELGLYDLRSKLTIIPQDPVLFTGSLRMNLDPFAMHSDAEIWIAIEQSHLKDYVQTLESGLEHEVTEGGDNLSVGQRQLLCLARALLRKTKVLIMDEATAAVDMETDELIQATIRSEFADCTVFTIAHRLNTILDYDRVIVLDKGEIAEFDSPTNLLANESSSFYSMAKDADLV